MSGAFRRPAALLLAVTAALTALVSGAAQAGAAPAAPAAGGTTITLHVPSADGVSPAATIVCHASSAMVLSHSSGDDYARATGTTTCPVPVTNVIAQTKLEQWSPLLRRWEVVSYGNYDSRPGRAASSVSGDHRCSEMPNYYRAVTYHQARLNRQYAIAVSRSVDVSC